MKSLLRLVAIVVAATMLCAGTAQGQPKDKVVLMLNWYLYSEHAPFFLGKERGFYDQEGIDLDIQEGRGSGVTVQAVAANTATFGYVDVPTMIKAAAKGAPVKSVGVALQLSPMSVIKTVAGDAQTKLNAVMNGQADLLLGYVMDQAIKLQDATKKPVYPIRFADYGVNMISSGIIINSETLKSKPDMVKRFLRATTRALEESEKNPEAAVDAMLKANSKAGVRETLIIGLKQTTALYHTKETAKERPLRVSMSDVRESLDLLAQYGGLDPATKGKAEDWVVLDYLP